jgi:hypothetical protein
MLVLFEKGGYTRTAYGASNARAWLRGQGAYTHAADGRKQVKKVDGHAVAVWRGVREIGGNPFDGIESARAELPEISDRQKGA